MMTFTSMKKLTLSRLRVASSRRRFRARRLRLEALECRCVLDATADFGFVDRPGGFAFFIIGTDDEDLVFIETNPVNLDTQIEINDSPLSLSHAQLVEEATERGWNVADFEGFLVRSGDGDDFVDGAKSGYPLTVSAGDGDDSVTGSPFSEMLDGGDGDDTLLGGPGHDTINGGDGDDDLSGGEDRDVLKGGPGDDSLLGDNMDQNPTGGPGKDGWQAGKTTNGGIVICAKDIEKIDTTGADTGEPTKDFRKPGPFPNEIPLDHPDWIDASDADEKVTIVTGGGGDSVWGGNSDDVLDTGPGNDVVYGNLGNDIILAGDDDDMITGGAGADSLDGGHGKDTVSYRDSPDPVNIDLSSRVQKGGEAENDYIVKKEKHDSTIEGVLGSDFDDSISGDGDHNYIQGFSGNDNLDGGKGMDTLNGGKGNDILMGGEGNDALIGAGGVDGYLGGIGDDILFLDYVRGVAPGTGYLGDLESDPFIFGDEGKNNFVIEGACGPLDQIDVASELAIAETFGYSDFDPNEDVLSFDDSSCVEGEILATATNPENGHVYHVIGSRSGEGLSWTAAHDIAMSLGGHLATINNQAENDWVAASFSGFFYLWIGLTDRAEEGQFVWASGQPVEFTNWWPGEPKNLGGTENYVLMYNFSAGQYKWNDSSNSDSFVGNPVFALVEIEAP